MSRLNALSAKTDSILDALNAAQDALGGAGRHCNGWGVMHDVASTRGRVVAAIDHLLHAKSLIDTTTWPTDAEYETLEREHNRR